MGNTIDWGKIHALSYGHDETNLVGSAPAPSFTGLLDTYSGAYAAYSVRKLSSSYSGSAVRVRNKFTQTETNIGFDSNGDLDMTALAAAANESGDTKQLGVVTWYDQSGNGNDATQSKASAQPNIYLGSGPILENGKPTIQLDSVDDYFDTSFAIGVTSNFSAFTIVSINDLSSLKYIWDARDGSTDGLSVFADPFVGINAIRSRLNATTLTDYPLLNGNKYLLSHIINSSTFDFYTNGGTPLTGSTSAINTTTNLRIGAASYTISGVMDGKITEFIIYKSDQSTNRTGIETNINEYYSIY